MGCRGTCASLVHSNAIIFALVAMCHLATCCSAAVVMQHQLRPARHRHHRHDRAEAAAANLGGSPTQLACAGGWIPRCCGFAPPRPILPAAEALRAAAAPLRSTRRRRRCCTHTGCAVALDALAGRAAGLHAEGRAQGTIGDRDADKKRGDNEERKEREGFDSAGLAADPTKTRLGGKSDLEVCRVINGLCQVRKMGAQRVCLFENSFWPRHGVRLLVAQRSRVVFSSQLTPIAIRQGYNKSPNYRLV